MIINIYSHYLFCFYLALLDALLCSDDNESAMSYLKECYRVLKTDGILIIISHGWPELRVPILTQNNFNWIIEHTKIGISLFVSSIIFFDFY